MKFSAFLFLLFFTFMQACTPDLERADIDEGRASVSKSVVIGDSYISGYQNGALSKSGQERSIGALVMRSFKAAGHGAFIQALMPEGDGIGRNAKPWESLYVSASKLGDRTDCKGVVSLGPLKTLYNPAQAQYFLDPVSANGINDLSIPFLSMSEMVYPAFSPSNEFLERYCASCTNGVPGFITAYQPSFSIVWSGMEDIFRFARNGGYGQSIAPRVTVEGWYNELFTYLTANNAKGVIAGIPDFRTMPFYTLIPWNGADLTLEKADSLTTIYAQAGLNHIVFAEGKNAFVIADVNAPGGYRQLVQGEYITLTVPLDSMKCYFYGLLINPIHDRYVLDSAEVNKLDAATAMFNEVIAQKAAQHDFAFVDMHAYFNRLNQGIYFNGVKYTNEFVSGGFFSLDGFHPTQKGANMIADQFILAINSFFGSTFPTVFCEDCEGLRFP